MRPQAQRPHSMPAVWCGLDRPIPSFPCQSRPRNTRLRKVPRTTDDAGGIVVVVREGQPIWCFEDAGSGTSSQVRSSVRTENWPSATFTGPSSKSGVGGVPVVAQRRAGEISTLFLAPGPRTERLSTGSWVFSGGLGHQVDGDIPMPRGGWRGKNKTKITMSTRDDNEVGPKDKRREGREENKNSGRAHCQGS